MLRSSQPALFLPPIPHCHAQPDGLDDMTVAKFTSLIWGRQAKVSHRVKAASLRKAGSGNIPKAVHNKRRGGGRGYNDDRQPNSH